MHQAVLLKFSCTPRMVWGLRPFRGLAWCRLVPGRGAERREDVRQRNEKQMKHASDTPQWHKLRFQVPSSIGGSLTGCESLVFSL